ncbi:hypothetical protein MMC21_007127 [Puttea exsequens]|nr:hypothetical protein [Puttea exsequens]
MSKLTAMMSGSEGIMKAYETGAFTDLTITCGGKDIKVHKLVVCTQSEVLRKTATNGFKESLTSVINLPDDDLALVERMIEALYSSTYDSTVSDAEQATYGCHGFELHAAMYAIADKYGLAELKHLAQHRYRALQLPTHEAKIAFLKSIARIYSTTPAHDQSLRKIALHWVKQKPFVGVDEEVKEFLRDVLEEVPDFNWELHLSWMGDRVEIENSVTPSKRAASISNGSGNRRAVKRSKE